MKIKQVKLVILNLLRSPERVYKRLSDIQESLGRIEAKLNYAEKIEKSEFKVYSQWGEDGIIQHIINKINPENNVFIEFGVENGKLTYLSFDDRFSMINELEIFDLNQKRKIKLKDAR